MGSCTAMQLEHFSRAPVLPLGLAPVDAADIHKTEDASRLAILRLRSSTRGGRKTVKVALSFFQPQDSHVARASRQLVEALPIFE